MDSSCFSPRVGWGSRSTQSTNWPRKAQRKKYHTFRGPMHLAELCLVVGGVRKCPSECMGREEVGDVRTSRRFGFLSFPSSFLAHNHTPHAYRHILHGSPLHIFTAQA